MMSALKYTRALLMVCSLVVILRLVQGFARQNLDASKTSLQHTPAELEQHDFDFAIGTWKTHLSRLQHPLTGSTTWVEYEGTTVVRKVWNGRANLVELNRWRSNRPGRSLCCCTEFHRFSLAK